MGALIPEDNNFGALFIGVVLSAMYVLFTRSVCELIFSPFRVYGITWQQGYAYYTVHGNSDRLFIKILVSSLAVVQCLR
jgi:hypothetical protein